MKKIMLLLLILSSWQLGYSQDVSSLLQSARTTKNVDRIKIPRFMMSIIKVGMPMFTSEDIPMLNGIHGLEVMDMESCSIEDRRSCVTKINDLTDFNDYELLMKAKDGKDNVMILAKMKKETIKDLLIINIDRDIPQIVRIWGKLNMSEINEFIAKQND